MKRITYQNMLDTLDLLESQGRKTVDIVNPKT